MRNPQRPKECPIGEKRGLHKGETQLPSIPPQVKGYIAHRFRAFFAMCPWAYQGILEQASARTFPQVTRGHSKRQEPFQRLGVVSVEFFQTFPTKIGLFYIILEYILRKLSEPPGGGGSEPWGTPDGARDVAREKNKVHMGGNQLPSPPPQPKGYNTSVLGLFFNAPWACP